MKQYGRRAIEAIGLLCLGLLLFSFPANSAEGARKGITLCLDLLIPSLFPFFVLSSLFIKTGLAGLFARPLQHLMYPLFGVGGAGATPLILGILGGYPVGARTVAQLRTQNECSAQEAQRLALFCNNCGPAFLVGAVGVGIFGSESIGFLLLAANSLSAILLGIGLHVVFGKTQQNKTTPTTPLQPLSAVFPDCVHSAFSSSLNVCAYVILFSVLTALADCSGILPAISNGFAALFGGENSRSLCRSFFIGLVELSTGTAALEPSVPLALPLAAFILAWGGLSVHCQTLPFWQAADIRATPYLIAKLVQGLLSAGLLILLLPHFSLSLPVMAPAKFFPAPTLFGREIFALWLLSGVYFFVFGKKGTGKDRWNVL